jgi:hypothetical protein
MGSRKTFTAQELDQLAERTLEHYRARAEDFRGTRDHDVSQNIATLLEHIVGTPPFTSSTSAARARPGGVHAARSPRDQLEGAAPFVAMAREATGCRCGGRT